MAGSGRRTADFRLLAELAAGATFEDAAVAAGISERTVRRRMADPDFRARVHDARGRFLDSALGQLAEASTQMVTTLLDLARSAESESVRLGAIRTGLENVVRLREQSEILERIGALEKRLRDLHDPKLGRVR